MGESVIDTGSERRQAMNEMNAVREEHENGSDGDWGSWCSPWDGEWCWHWWSGTRRSGRLDAAGWAALLLWAAGLIAAERLGLTDRFPWWDGWALFLIGAGAIVLAKIVFRTFSPYRRRSEAIGVIFALFLIGLGLAGFTGGTLFLPIFLTAVAVYILLGLFTRR
jgi:hypothetical protein